jgi:thiamine kinase-like enzyme
VGLSIATVLADLPGWENAAATALSGGLTNHTWLVDNGDAKAVLKLDPVPRGAPYSARPREAAVQSIAAEHGLAPRVLHVDDCVLMTEFVEGEVWQPGTFAVDDNIENLANALRRLHALPLTGRSFDAPHAAAGYLDRMNPADRDLAARCLQIIEAQALPRNPCVCHNDLVAANILSAGSIMFLDWEYACDNDPFFDLATIVEHHGLDDDLAMRLLDAYCGGDGRRQLAQLRAQQALYAALYWMWLAARPDTTSAELERAASRIRD